MSDDDHPYLREVEQKAMQQFTNTLRNHADLLDQTLSGAADSDAACRNLLRAVATLLCTLGSVSGHRTLEQVKAAPALPEGTADRMLENFATDGKAAILRLRSMLDTMLISWGCTAPALPYDLPLLFANLLLDIGRHRAHYTVVDGMSRGYDYKGI